MMTGVLLAAGASTRMGSAKALARAGTESFVARGIRNLWAACDVVYVVLGSDAARIRDRIEDEFCRLVGSGAFDREMHAAHRQDVRRLEVRFVLNRAWKKGMLTSARAGLTAALRGRPEAVLVLPVDHPSVRPATVAVLSAVMAQAVRASGRPKAPRAGAPGFRYALVPRYRGRRGHPVALSAALARAVAADGKAEHLADAVRRSARLVGYLDVADAGIVRNVNRPGD